MFGIIILYIKDFFKFFGVCMKKYKKVFYKFCG